MANAIKGDVRPRYLSVREVAARWGVSVATVYRMIGDGDIRALLIANTRRISVDEVELYEAAQAEQEYRS